MFRKITAPRIIDNNVLYTLNNSENSIGELFNVGQVIFELKYKIKKTCEHGYDDLGNDKLVYGLYFNQEYIGDFTLN